MNKNYQFCFYNSFIYYKKTKNIKQNIIYNIVYIFMHLSN